MDTIVKQGLTEQCQDSTCGTNFNAQMMKNISSLKSYGVGILHQYQTNHVSKTLHGI